MEDKIIIKMLMKKKESGLSMLIEKYGGFIRDNILLEKEDKGIKLIINEAIYDDKKILVSTTIDYNNMDKNLAKEKEKYDIVPELGKIEIYSNGKKVEHYGEGMRGEDNEDGTIDILLNASGWKEELGDEIEIRIGMDSMDIQYPYKEKEEIKGDWSVKFKIDTKKVKEDTRSIKIDRNLKLKDGKKEIEVKINDLRITPLSMRLRYEGNRMDFKFYDEKDKEIEFTSEGGGSESGLSYEWIRDREIKKIKVVPFIKNKLGIEKKFEEATFEININDLK
ncbi:MAG: DUF4179 domain-containing protein [Clostridium sp.]|uniref:DUF4179 domain-containing protein n=1 Tax=Clostridium sp. TaxID=1506 RepID=UPI003F3604BD